MSAAAAIALVCYKGEDFEADGTHRAGSATAAVVDLTGWTIVCTVRRKPTDADPALLSVSASLVVAGSGTYKIVFSAAQTLALGVGDFHVDVWRTNAGSQTEMAVGTLQVLQPVRNP